MAHRVGVVGLGIMGRRLIQRMQDNGRFQVAVGWDPSPDAVAAARDLAPDMAVANNAEALCATPGLDMVYVASPPASHVAHATAALTAGHAVLCEKPLSVDLPASEGLVRLAAERGLRNAVNFPMATTGALAHLRRALADGTLGAVPEVTVEVAFREWPRPWQKGAAAWLDAREEGGFTREVASHFLFLMHRLFGPLAVQASRVDWPADGRSERAVEARLTAGSMPVRLSGHVGRIAADDHNVVMFRGPAGTLRLTDWYRLEREVGGRWQPVPEAKDPGPVGQAHVHAVADWLEGKPAPLATFAEALEVQRCAEALLAGRGF